MTEEDIERQNEDREQERKREIERGRETEWRQMIKGERDRLSDRDKSWR